jgi:hypothetical protein
MTNTNAQSHRESTIRRVTWRLVVKRNNIKDISDIFLVWLLKNDICLCCLCCFVVVCGVCEWVFIYHILCVAALVPGLLERALIFLRKHSVFHSSYISSLSMKISFHLWVLYVSLSLLFFFFFLSVVSSCSIRLFPRHFFFYFFISSSRCVFFQLLLCCFVNS